MESAAEQTFARTLAEVHYAEVPALLAAVDRTARLETGDQAAAALAVALTQLQDDIDAGFSGRVMGVLAGRVGAAADPLLSGACARLGLAPEAIDAERLPEVAAAIHDATVALFGAETAGVLRTALLGVTGVRPAGLTVQIQALAREHLGEDGDAVLDRLCRQHLEIALDDLDPGNVGLLALAVERHGPGVIETVLPTTFVAEASAALASPAASLRQQITALTREVIGPLAPEFLDEVCREHGMPFEAVDYEHLMWLGEVLRAEVEPLAGKAAADSLARELRTFLTGKR